MLKNYKHLAFKEGNGAYFCCSCGKRWTVNDGNPLADACPSCGTKLKYEDIPVPPHGEWISTDVDCTQYRRDASEKGEGVFESAAPEYDTETEYSSFEEASKIIGATIGVDVFDFI